VAAVGNGPQSPDTPWNFAHYPASLPHVIGVSAVRQDGSVPDYSNRDAVYNDLAAPGDGLFSTLPTNLVESRPGCSEPYSDCGPFEFRVASGTSFAAPQVSAAAALLLGQDPSLRPEQVAWLLERGADDASAATGCAVCPAERDKLTGWGTLDVENSLKLLTQGPLPAVDHYEPNDNAGPWAHALPPLPRTILGTLDYWDDNLDVYRVYVHKGSRLYARVTPIGADSGVRMSIWAPGTQRVDALDVQAFRLAESRSVRSQSRVSYRASGTGIYYLELRIASPTLDPLSYRLALARG
jgi:hypothetical protein